MIVGSVYDDACIPTDAAALGPHSFAVWMQFDPSAPKPNITCMLVPFNWISR
jgi:hypothetical protein